MPSQLYSYVKKLNRLSRLYDYAILNATPYRIGRIRKFYQKTLLEVSAEFEIQVYDMSNYRKLFGTNEKLELVDVKKNEAISSFDYESAATLRDRQKAMMWEKLLSIGVCQSARFFTVNNQLYKIP